MRLSPSAFRSRAALTSAMPTMCATGPLSTPANKAQRDWKAGRRSTHAAAMHKVLSMSYGPKRVHRHFCAHQASQHRPYTRGGPPDPPAQAPGRAYASACLTQDKLLGVYMGTRMARYQDRDLPGPKQSERARSKCRWNLIVEADACSASQDSPARAKRKQC